MISDTPTPGASPSSTRACPIAEGDLLATDAPSAPPAGDGQSTASPAEHPITRADAEFAAKLLALQALAYQRILLDRALREFNERAYRKRGEIDDRIRELTRGMKMPIHGNDFIIKARRQTTVANQEHMSPSERKRARMRASISVEAA